MSRSVRFVIAQRKSQSNCYFKFLPSISPFSARYFTFCAGYFNKNSKTTNQSDLRNNAQHVIKALFRSIFGPVLESIRYNVNSAWGNRTGPDLFTPCILDRYLFWSGKSKPTLESKRAIMRFRSKNGGDLLKRSFTLGAERSKNLSDTECITSGIGAFQLIIVTGIVPDWPAQM